MRVLTTALVLVLFVAPVSAEPPTFQELEESLTCQCGCGLTVHSCNHLQCPSAIPLREEIRAQMELGKDKDATLAYFAGKYGEKILSSPTTSGFNLIAWTAPFVALAIGGLLVGFTLVRWRRAPRRAAVGAGPAPVKGEGRSELEKVLDRELERFDG